MHKDKQNFSKLRNKYKVTTLPDVEYFQGIDQQPTPQRPTDLSSANGSVILWVGGGGVIALIRFNMFKTVFIVSPRNNYITFVFKPIDDDDEHHHIAGLEDLHISSPFTDFYKSGQTRIDILYAQRQPISSVLKCMSYSDNNNNCLLSVGEGL